MSRSNLLLDAAIYVAPESGKPSIALKEQVKTTDLDVQSSSYIVILSI